MTNRNALALPALPLAEQIGYERLDRYLYVLENKGPLSDANTDVFYNNLAWGHAEAGLVAAAPANPPSNKSVWDVSDNHFTVAKGFADRAQARKDCCGNIFVHAAQLQIDMPLLSARCSGQRISEAMLTERDAEAAELLAATRGQGTFNGKAVPEFHVAHERQGAIMSLGIQLLCARGEEVWYTTSARERITGRNEQNTSHDFYSIDDGDKWPVKGCFKTRAADRRITLVLFRPIVMNALKELEIVAEDIRISAQTTHEYTDVVLDALVNDARGSKLTTLQRDMLDTVADMVQVVLAERRPR